MKKNQATQKKTASSKKTSLGVGTLFLLGVVFIAVLALAIITTQQNIILNNAATPSPGSDRMPGRTVIGFTPTPTVVYRGEIYQVDSISVALLESFPVQAQVTVTGQLEDTCTTIDQVIPVVDVTTISLVITTLRTPSAGCRSGSTPFETSAPLNIRDFKAGVYTVEAYGKITTFTLPVDNTLTEP